MVRSIVIVLVLILLGVASLGAQNIEKFTITLDVPSRGNVTLVLERHDAFAPGSRIQIMRPAPARPMYVDPSTIKVYRGSLPNEPKSFVVLAVSSSGTIGSIHAGEERFDVRRGPFALSPLQITRNDVQSKPCVVSEEKISSELMQLMHEKPSENVQDAETLELQIAVEADYQFYERNDLSRDKALAYIAQVVGVTSAIYERDFNVRITTSNVRLWEDPSDPYPEDQTVFSLLYPFSQLYEAEMSSVQRDIAVFLTMRNGSGGVAMTIGGLCEPGMSYCAADLAGDLSKIPNSFSWDQMVVSHELGHVCGAVHTQSCIWPGGPLDSCVTSEFGDCVRRTQTRPAIGTIMSYCHQRRSDGGGLKAEFHPRHKHVVRAYLERATCVGGRAAIKNSVLRGRLIDTANQVGVAGAELHLVAYNTGPYLGTQQLGADTISVTAADGFYEFKGLSDGIYIIILPTDWVVLPVEISDEVPGVTVMVSGDTVQRDIEVVRGVPVTTTLQTNGDATDINLVIVSKNIKHLYDVLPVPGATAALGTPTTQILPVGLYTIVPYAAGRRFTPLYIDVDATGAAPLPVLTFTSTSTAPSITAPLVTVSSINNDGLLTLSTGDEIEITNLTDNTTMQRITGANGVAVFENLDVNESFMSVCTTDTLLWAPSSANNVIASSGFGYPTVFESRPRLMPLIARPYQVAVTNETYVALTGAERILSPDAITIGAARPQYLPFAVSLGPVRSAKIWVYPSGDLVFGQYSLSAFEPPLSSFAEAPFVISTFSTRFVGSSSALDESGVWWKISGEAPNRIISIEWRNLQARQCDQFGECANYGTFTFQAHIAEHSGIIRMVYGDIDPEDAEIPYNIGLRGRDKLDTRIISAAGGQNNWDSPTTSNIAGTGYNLSVEASAIPVSGLTYTWFNSAVGVDDDAEAGSRNRATAHADVIRIAPSPASDELIIKGLTQGARLRLADVMGRVVLSTSETNAHAVMNVRALASGRYALHVDTNTSTTVHPVIISR